MSDTGATNQRLLFCRFGQICHFPQTTQTRHMALRVNHCQTGRVITAILKTTQTFQQNFCNVTLRYCTNNSTHISFLTSWLSAIALSSDLISPEPCREWGIYPSYFKFQVRWLRAFTSVTDFSKSPEDSCTCRLPETQIISGSFLLRADLCQPLKFIFS
jgi:hypothetical protein